MWPRAGLRALLGLVVPLVLLGLSPVQAQAARTEIEYSLSGTLDWVVPRARRTGIQVGFATVRFDSTPAGEILPSADVTILTFGFSYFLAVQPKFGSAGRYLLSPGITGGHLNGSTATGSGVGLARARYWYCTYSGSGCTTQTSVVQTLFEGHPFPPYAYEYMNTRGWVFNADFSTLQVTRWLVSFRGDAGTVRLAGSEISRITTPEPSPLPLALLGLAGAGGAALLSRLRAPGRRRAG